MKRIIARVLIVLTAVFTLVSGCQCGHDDPEKYGYDQVLFLYAGGFNSLSRAIRQNIREIEQGYIPKKKDDRALLVVSHLTDSLKGYEFATKISLDRIYLNGKKEVVHETINDTYGGNLSDPETMKAILSDIKRLFPSKHYGMIVSSHATGWLPYGYYSIPAQFESTSGKSGSARRAAAREEEPEGLPEAPLTKTITNTFPEIEYKKTGNYYPTAEMEITDFKDAIPMHLDYLLFDACLMGCIEVAYELKDKCDLIGFSPAEILAEGFNYYTLTGHLLGNPTPDVRAVVDDYFQKIANKSDKTLRAATITLADCSKLDGLAAECRTLFEKYSSQIEEVDPYDVQRFWRSNKHWFYDLEDILVKAGMSEEDHNRLKTALDRCIIYKAATDGFLKGYSGGGYTISTYCGFSMYLPNYGSTYLDDFYKGFAWNKATGLVD